MHSEPVIARGACHVLFAYEVAQAIDLDAAEARLAAERQTVKHKRRAPAFFEYRPPPLRVTRPGVAHAVGIHATAPAVDIVLYDFGAVSVSYDIPLADPLGALPALADALWGHAGLLADSRRQVEALLDALGDAAVRPRIAASVEDYAIFHIEAFTAPLAGAALWEEHGHTVAQILRAEPRALSQQEVGDALSSRLAFGPADATFIDTDAALVFDAEGDDVLAVLELVNTQLLEMRFLDEQLDDALERAYEALARRRGGRHGPDIERLAQLQLDSAILFEQVTNAVKLVGEQYLARVYALVSRRFHLAEWDASITRKLETMDSIYSKMTDRAATRRMETLEWIIIGLIAIELVLSLVTAFAQR
jgi:hypothetical protein